MNGKRFVRKLLSCLSVLLLGCFVLVSTPAIASIHQYPEGNGQVMWRSLQTLRDSDDRAWQLVLFKRNQQGITQSLHLRLVGFPGVVELSQTQPLQISTTTGKQWQVKVLTSAVPIATHVGEYDLLDVMRDLDSDRPLRLTLPTQPSVELVVPPFVVQEWRRLAGQTS